MPTLKPATPLPWSHGCPTAQENYIMVGGHTVIAELPRTSQGSEYVVDQTKDRTANARYIVAACNAYPRLVDALQALVGHADLGEVDLEADERVALDGARTLLRTLGEE